MIQKSEKPQGRAAVVDSKPHELPPFQLDRSHLAEQRRRTKLRSGTLQLEQEYAGRSHIASRQAVKLQPHELHLLGSVLTEYDGLAIS